MKGLSVLARKKNGSGLLELIIALSVILLVLLSLVSVGIVSLKNITFTKNRITATKFAQEGMEKIRSYRDQNTWTTFSDETNCESLVNKGLSSIPRTGYTLGVICSLNGTTMTVTVTASWRDGNGVHKSEIISYFTDKSSW